MSTILAIDPGLRGGFAYGHADGRLVSVHRMPGKFSGIFTLIQHLNPATFVIEDVGMAFGLGASVKSSYRFARHRGVLEALIYAATLRPARILWVRPQLWQAFMLPARVQTLADRVAHGRKERDTKEEAMDYATKNFCDFSLDTWTADAVCLFAYATLTGVENAETLDPDADV